MSELQHSDVAIVGAHDRTLDEHRLFRQRSSAAAASHRPAHRRSAYRPAPARPAPAVQSCRRRQGARGDITVQRADVAHLWPAHHAADLGQGCAVLAHQVVALDLGVGRGGAQIDPALRLPNFVQPGDDLGATFRGGRAPAAPR